MFEFFEIGDIYPDKSNVMSYIIIELLFFIIFIYPYYAL